MSALKPNNDAMLAVMLVVGAMIFTRSQRAVAAPVGTSGNLNTLPGNVGTGAAQAVGGALGGLLSSLFATGFTPNANGAGYTTDWSSQMAANPELVDNMTQYGV